MDKEKKAEKPKDTRPFQAWQFAWELGYSIAIPIVLLALLGRILDKHFGTSPLLLLAGVVLSVFISTWLIYRKMKEFLE